MSPSLRPARLPGALRQLFYPLLIALLLHALVLWQAPGWLPSLEAPAAASGNVHARIAPPVAAAPQPEAQLPPAKTPDQGQATKSPPQPNPEPIEPAPAPDQPASTPEPPEYRPSPPTEVAKPGIDVSGLRQYHLALGQKAKQFRRYPPEAREAGWQGRVTMRLAVSENGAPIGIRLLGSSNFPVLDQAALEMMYLAAGHTEVPESLRGRAFTIDLAVDFNPDDAP